MSKTELEKLKHDRERIMFREQQIIEVFKKLDGVEDYSDVINTTIEHVVGCVFKEIDKCIEDNSMFVGAVPEKIQTIRYKWSLPIHA